MSEGLVLLDGFEDAFLGVARLPDLGLNVAVYDPESIVKILVNRDGMSWEEARDYFGFNIETAYIGERSPIFLEACDLDQIPED